MRSLLASLYFVAVLAVLGCAGDELTNGDVCDATAPVLCAREIGCGIHALTQSACVELYTDNCAAPDDNATATDDQLTRCVDDLAGSACDDLADGLYPSSCGPVLF